MAEKNTNSDAPDCEPAGENAGDALQNQAGGQRESREHPFAKWMRPTTNAGKARSNGQMAEIESHWLDLLAAAEAREGHPPATPSEPLRRCQPEDPAPPLVAADAHLFRAQGWAVSPPVMGPTALKRMRFLGETVRNAGFPRVFAYLYEDMWRILRSRACRDTLAHWLGESHRQLPGLWFHHVPAVAGARGWGPHVDAAKGPEWNEWGQPDRLTIWIPLVDVDAARACMFVVPTSETPPGLAQKILADAQLPTDLALRLMHAARPLPCDAGSLVAWCPNVLHWGGIHQGTQGPRSAISLEFLRAGLPLCPTEELGLAADEIPDFPTRLYLVARGLLAYGKAPEREPFASTFLPWAESVYRRYAPKNRDDGLP